MDSRTAELKHSQSSGGADASGLGAPSRSGPGESFLITHLDRIRDRVERRCARSSMRHEADDCFAWVCLRLADDDYAKLRQHRPTHDPMAFLDTVVDRLVSDYRDHLWGRWRPSRMAQRLGVIAVELERLHHRDGHTWADAVRVVEARAGCSTEEIEEIIAQLPQRMGRPVAVSGDLSRESDPEVGGADLGVEASALRRQVHRDAEEMLLTTVRQVLGELPQIDRRMLRLHYREGMSLVELARREGRREHYYQRRMHRCRERIRGALRERGLDLGELRDSLSLRDLELTWTRLLGETRRPANDEFGRT